MFCVNRLYILICLRGCNWPTRIREEIVCQLFKNSPGASLRDTLDRGRSVPSDSSFDNGPIVRVHINFCPHVEVGFFFLTLFCFVQITEKSANFSLSLSSVN